MKKVKPSNTRSTSDFNLEQNINYSKPNFYRSQKLNIINPIENNNNINNKMMNKIINHNNIKNKKDENEIPRSESSLSASIYEKNISLLNTKIKEQENNIKYLNSRLENYDMTMEQITKLNIEINKLNEIIRNKNNTIQEFRDISDLSKVKIEELMKNKNELIEKINTLEEENKKLKNNLNKIEDNYNNHKNNDYNLDDIVKENNELKSEIIEKNKKIKSMRKIIEKLKNNINYDNKFIKNKMDYIDYKKKNNIIEFNNIYKKNEKYLKEPSESFYNLKKLNPQIIKNYPLNKRSHTPLIKSNCFDNYRKNPVKKYHNINYSLIKEPNYLLSSPSCHSKNVHSNIIKYNCLRNKYTEEPLDYSNYLIDNLADSICRKYYKLN